MALADQARNFQEFRFPIHSSSIQPIDQSSKGQTRSLVSYKRVHEQVVESDAGKDGARSVNICLGYHG